MALGMFSYHNKISNNNDSVLKNIGVFANLQHLQH